MRKNSDLVSLALAAAVLAAAILLSPWATRALSTPDGTRAMFAADYGAVAPRDSCNVPGGATTQTGCAAARATPEDSGVSTARVGKPF